MVHSEALVEPLFPYTNIKTEIDSCYYDQTFELFDKEFLDYQFPLFGSCTGFDCYDVDIKKEIDIVAASLTEPPPEPTDSKTSIAFTIEWCHKKGKKKPQQYWVYCEESQLNYAKISLLSSNFQWSATSKMMLEEKKKFIVFVEDSHKSTDNVKAIYFDPKDNYATARTGSFNPYNLTEVDPSRIRLQLQLIEDFHHPFHPHQGKATEVDVTQDFITQPVLPAPFLYLSKFTFKNRAEGWFRLNACLFYDDYQLISGNSEVFMFNNPRMKKRKEFLNYSPSQIKLMQIFSLLPTIPNEQWELYGIQYGLQLSDVRNLIELSPHLFPTKVTCLTKRKRTTLKEEPSRKKRAYNGS